MLMADGASSEHGLPHRLSCPVLHAHDGARDEGSLRGEIFSLDRLEEHARVVARSHGAPSLQVPSQPLLATFAATKQRPRVEFDIADASLRGGRRGANEVEGATRHDEWLQLGRWRLGRFRLQ